MTSRKAGDPAQTPYRYTLPLHGIHLLEPELATEDLGRRVAMRDLRQRWEPVGDDSSLHVVVSERGAAFFRGRMASARARAYRYFEGERRRIELEHRGPGYTWRGWWYPRWLVLGILWLVIAANFGLLVAGLFRLFGGAA